MDAGRNHPSSEDGDLQVLVQELCQLRARQKKLTREVEKHKVFEDYLLQVLEKIPKGCKDPEEPKVAPLKAMVEHYSQLLSARQDIQAHLQAFSQMNQAAHQRLQSLEDSHRALVPSLKVRLCQLQKRCHRKHEQWRQLARGIASEDDADSDPEPQTSKSHVSPPAGWGQGMDWDCCSQQLSSVKLLINNMAQHCCSGTQRELSTMGLFSQLNLIKEFMLDKMETVRMISLLTEPSKCCSGDSRKNQRPRSYLGSLGRSPGRQDPTPRTPFPSARTSECSSLS
ncbi:uncharacterized protein CCDC197 [Ochotona curzoniae]|uniref:uncharacterized protein CCDC197 n=1 Tax=Ochotona curzoniae TaxID=130825 RepID=UPI001B347DEC|nr:uncharacterized protein CCDC197 [Ochotona curzoniae]